jgi:hypothetical protein
MEKINNMNLHQLLYVSVEAINFSKENLETLLIGARKFNSEHNISGFLVYADGMFLQCLEGDYDEITTLYKHIALDHRHKQVQKIFDKEIKERVFSDWSMGFTHASAEDLEKYGFKSINDFVLKREDENHPAIVFMSSIIKNNRG